MNDKLPLLWEMETSDPDDFLTLCWLADHPAVDLKAVLVTPGGRDQCQLVRWGLDQCGRPDVPIGALHASSWWVTAELKNRLAQLGDEYLDVPVKLSVRDSHRDPDAACEILSLHHLESVDAGPLVQGPPGERSYIHLYFEGVMTAKTEGHHEQLERTIEQAQHHLRRAKKHLKRARKQAGK